MKQMEKPDYRPLAKNVIVKQDSSPATTDSNFILDLSDTRHKRPSKGNVVAIGDNITEVRIGDRVCFGDMAGVYCQIQNGQDLLILTEDEISGKLVNS